MRKVDSFVAGLDIMRKKIRSVSFYNSSGGDARFNCDGLSSSEQGRLCNLGWLEVGDDGASFSEWGEEDT